MEQSEGYCQGMKRWMKYCRERVTEETPTTAYMVTEEGTEDEEGLYLYLDSGCNHTCHGELWLRKFVEKTGYEPPWLHQEEKELNGIGGKTKTLGEREFYILDVIKALSLCLPKLKILASSSATPELLVLRDVVVFGIASCIVV